MSLCCKTVSSWLAWEIQQHIEETSSDDRPINLATVHHPCSWITSLQMLKTQFPLFVLSMFCKSGEVSLYSDWLNSKHTFVAIFKIYWQLSSVRPRTRADWNYPVKQTLHVHCSQEKLQSKLDSSWCVQERGLAATEEHWSHRVQRRQWCRHSGHLVSWIMIV